MKKRAFAWIFLAVLAGCQTAKTAPEVKNPPAEPDMPPVESASSMVISSAQAMVDQPAPAVKFADARGVPKGLRLADLKGQWVLLEFWGFWCGPCVQYGLPEMMEFHDQFQSKLKGKLTILAVHEGSRVNTIKEVVAESARAREDLWKRNLPFPIVCDTPDQNVVRSFKIDRFPTKVLIDPQGKVASINPDLGMVAEWAKLK